MTAFEIAQDKMKRANALQAELKKLTQERGNWAVTRRVLNNFSSGVEIKPYVDFASYPEFIRGQADSLAAGAASGVAEIIRQFDKAISEREMKLLAIFPDTEQALSDEPSDTGL